MCERDREEERRINLHFISYYFNHLAYGFGEKKPELLYPNRKSEGKGDETSFFFVSRVN